MTGYAKNLGGVTPWTPWLRLCTLSLFFVLLALHKTIYKMLHRRLRMKNFLTFFFTAPMIFVDMTVDENSVAA